MTDGDALLASILAHPAEDTPRLAYADWLDEHDQHERAEFIRVQIELARLEADRARLEAAEPRGKDDAWLADYRKRAHETQRDMGLLFQREWACGCVLCLRKRESGLREREQRLLAEPRNFVNWTPAVMHTGSGAGIRYETGGKVGLFARGFEEAEFRRGFIESLACTAANWFDCAPAITSAHPVTHVKLTTAWTAGVFQKRDGSHCDVRSLADFLTFLRGEYPRIIFDLPVA